MSLSEVVWPQFTMQVFGGADSTLLWGQKIVWGATWYYRGSRRATIFTWSDSFPVKRTV